MNDHHSRVGHQAVYHSFEVEKRFNAIVDKEYLNVMNNAFDGGAMAAKHFLSLGTFNGFGFLYSGDRRKWQNMREQGFRTTLAVGFVQVAGTKKWFFTHAFIILYYNL